MKNIYKKLEDGCSFLIELGYSYCCKIESFIHPSVLFLRDSERLLIGIDYETHRMFCNYYEKPDDLHSIDLLTNINFISCKKYDEVIEKGLENLKKIIKNEQN